MNAARTSRRLLRLYPPAWRTRYGEELEALIVDVSGGGRVPWRMRLELVLAAAREHAHVLHTGSAGRPAHGKTRSGAMLVLWAWMLFVCAGIVVQKLSEHWQASVPAARRAVPASAFDGLVAGAAAGAAIVAIGAALLLPSLMAFVRCGRFSEVRHSVTRSAGLSLLTAAAAIGVVVWAHQLGTPQRNGGDSPYEGAVIAFALLGAVCLASWVATTSAITSRLALPARTLRLEALVATGIVIAMAAMTFSTVVWWRSLADDAPGWVPVPVAVMVVALTLGAIGSARALRSSANGPAQSG
jgi:hypothetical protein